MCKNGATHSAVKDTEASWVETQDSVMPQPVIQNEPSAASEPPEGDFGPDEISELVLQPAVVRDGLLNLDMLPLSF